MALAYVQDILGGPQADVTSATTAVVTTTATVASGSLIVGTAWQRNATARALSSVSGGGLTWAVDVDTNNTRTASIFSAQAPSGLASGTVITLTWSASSTRKGISMHEVSGAVTSAALDQVGQNTAGASSTPTVSTAGATSQAAEIVFAQFANNPASAETGTPGSGYTEIADLTVGASTFAFGYAEYQIVSATGVQTAGCTTSLSQGYDAAIATYKEATASNQTVSPPAATASASAPLPAVQLQVPPAAATASASSPTPADQLQVAPAASTAAASAPTPALQLRLSPGVSSATASALVPTVSVATIVSPPAATASASSPLPAVQLRVSPAAATASASAPVPIVTTAPVVAPPTATSSASSPTPTLQLQLATPVATSSASSPLPTIQLRLSPPAATAAAVSPTSTPHLRVSPSVATASATAPIPLVTSTGGGGVAPPITIRTYLVGASGRTRARGLLSATTATGTSGILVLAGTSGLTHAIGTSGQTGVT